MTMSRASIDDPECLQVKLLSKFATMPSRRTCLSAGYDLSSAEKTTVPSGGRAVVATDLSIACPEGTYARIAPRSGLAVQNMISCGAGVIDADYRGNVSAVLFNFGTGDFEVNIGDRIAQLILERASLAPAIEVDELTKTQRGERGFGSTGIRAKTPSKKDSSCPNQSIFVRSPDKKIITITFNPSKTVSQVKDDIEQKLGMDRSDYLLYRDDKDVWCKRLDNEKFSLSDYGIDRNSRLIVKVPMRVGDIA